MPRRARAGVVLVVQDIGQMCADYSMSEIRDLNRARAYLRDLALRHGIPIADDVKSAVALCVASLRAEQNRATSRPATTPPP